MENLKSIKESLITCVQSQMANLQNVDAKELGEAVDMIKDLAEAIYYCDISKAMEESQENKEIARNIVTPNINYYYPPTYYNDGRRGYYDWDEKKYYSNNSNSNYGGTSSGSNMSMYTPYMRDSRDGVSPISRRMYMESKEMHQGDERQKQELENYMNGLTQDIMEMINNSSPDEKAMLSQKLRNLSDKIK